MSSGDVTDATCIREAAKTDGLDVIDGTVRMPARQIIDNAFESLYFLLHVRPEIDTVFFSRAPGEPVQLGSSTYQFGDDVRDLITEKLLALEKGFKPLESINSAALKRALPNRVALFSRPPSRPPASVGTAADSNHVVALFPRMPCSASSF